MQINLSDNIPRRGENMRPNRDYEEARTVTTCIGRHRSTRKIATDRAPTHPHERVSRQLEQEPTPHSECRTPQAARSEMTAPSPAPRASRPGPSRAKTGARDEPARKQQGAPEQGPDPDERAGGSARSSGFRTKNGRSPRARNRRPIRTRGAGWSRPKRQHNRTGTIG